MTETALTQNAVYIARPTIRVDGQDNERVSELLLAMDMREHDGGCRRSSCGWRMW
jgi:hypothetical protein